MSASDGVVVPLVSHPTEKTTGWRARRCYLLGTMTILILLAVQVRLDKANVVGNKAAKVIVKDRQHVNMNKTIDKPVFVLHVGLPKTGTTFLQHSLCGATGRKKDIRRAREILAADNMTYLGTAKESKCPPPHCHCLPHRRSSVFSKNLPLTAMIRNYPQLPEVKKIKLSEKLRTRVEELKRLGTHGMFVFEGLAESSPKQIKKLASLLNPSFHVVVVVMYRHLHEWVISLQGQINREPMLLNSWGHKDHLPFDMDHPDVMSTRLYRAVARHHYHPAEIAQENFRAAFDDVRVINSNGLTSESPGNPLLVHMTCELDGVHMPNTCGHAKTGKTLGNGAPQYARDSDEEIAIPALVDGAHELGWLNPKKLKHGRHKVIKQVMKYYHQNLSNQSDVAAWPQTCSTESSIHQLVNLSLQVGERLFGNGLFDVNEEANKIFHRKLHCHLDAAAVLQENGNQTWWPFFSNLARKGS